MTLALHQRVRPSLVHVQINAVAHHDAVVGSQVSAGFESGYEWAAVLPALG